MSASPDVLHHVSARGYHVEEVGIDVRYDVPDANSQHPVAHGWALVKNLLRTVEYQHPVRILGVPGFLFTLVGVGFGYWAIANYVASRTLPVGLVFVSSTFGLAGVLASFTAIILHALDQFSEQWAANGGD